VVMRRPGSQRVHVGRRGRRGAPPGEGRGARGNEKQIQQARGKERVYVWSEKGREDDGWSTACGRRPAGLPMEGGAVRL